MTNSEPINVDSTTHSDERSNNRTFCFPCCFGSRHSPPTAFACWERVQATSWSQSQSEVHPITGCAGDTWWSRSFMKARSWTEIVAGPRWKTFIRRFNRNRSSSLRSNGKYQYDPLSYALNFDEGQGQNGDFEDDGYDRFRNFSTRYAVATTIKTGSSDAGNDGVVFSVEREGKRECAE